MSPSVLLLSAYDAHSHRLWRERLCQLFPDWHWHCLSLPPRHFAWRIRSNGLYWAFEKRETLSSPFDLIIATSMVDLATLRGMLPRLANIPTLVYFHENQFAYPAGRQRNDNLEPLLVPVYSALCAQQVLFNSEYNRLTFLKGLAAFSRSMPEPFPVSALTTLEDAGVIPVPLPEASPVRQSENQCLNVLWNHRWEYDKDPELLLAIIQRCQKLDLPLRFHVVGQQFREQPQQFQEIDKLLHHWSEDSGIERGEFGHMEEQAYRALLTRCDIVLSTALHDFQGLAIQEACQAGCSPLAPNDLAYPEYLPGSCLYERRDNDAAQAAVDKLQQWIALKQDGVALPQADLSAYSGESVREQYLAVIKALGVAGFDR